MQATTRIAVHVTFLRMEARNPAPTPLPPDTDLVAVERCTVPFYRFLYGTVGGDYVWWLRRAMSDPAIAAVLAAPTTSIHVLYRGGQPAGFFEFDAAAAPGVNLAYFGLFPHAIGHGLGPAFLDAATEAAWSRGARYVTVNTCTADHRRALPNYLRAGFRRTRTVEEIWDIPDRLGLPIPDRLRL